MHTILKISSTLPLPKLYIASNGAEADFFKPYHQLEKRIAKEQQKLSHMTKGSSNYRKQKRHIAKLYTKAKH